MSRWTNKNRAAPSFAFPLDSLVKEKENTNRPVAARSAGTVGKWGTTSFTSIRTPSYSYAFKPPPVANDGTYNAANAPLDGGGLDNGSATAGGYVAAPEVAAPKLKKFFKSRNSAPPPPPEQHYHQPHPASVVAADSVSYLPPSVYHAHHSHSPPSPVGAEPPVAAVAAAKAAPKIRLKINKRALAAAAAAAAADAAAAAASAHGVTEVAPADEIPDATSVSIQDTPPPAKQAKPRKPTAKAAKAAATIAAAAASKPPPAEPTRKLARARKAVNYSETRSRSASPVRPAANAVATDAVLAGGEGHAAVDGGGGSGNSSPSKEHPPIKLRIFKGTAQLVRADSDDTSITAAAAAPQLTATPPSPVATTTTAASVAAKSISPSSPADDAIQSTAELLAVLSDDQPPPTNTHRALAASPVTPPSATSSTTATTPSPQTSAPPVASSSFQPIVTNCIKIKIKTNYAHMISESTAAATPPRRSPTPPRPATPPATTSLTPSPEPPSKRPTNARTTRNRKATASKAAAAVAAAAVTGTSSPPPPAIPVPMDTCDTMDSAVISSPSRQTASNSLKSPTISAQRRTARNRGSPAAVQPSPRASRRNQNNNNNIVDVKLPEMVQETIRPPVARSYGRKKKLPAAVTAAEEEAARVVEQPQPMETDDTADNVAETVAIDCPAVSTMSAVSPSPAPIAAVNIPAVIVEPPAPAVAEQPPAVAAIVAPVAPIVSKKKGSIFKSRATEAAAAAAAAASAGLDLGTSDGAANTAAAAKAKRHQLYRHKWDHDASMAADKTKSSSANVPTMEFCDDDDDDDDDDNNTVDSSDRASAGDHHRRPSPIDRPSAALTKVLRQPASRASPHLCDSAGATSSDGFGAAAAGSAASFSAFTAAGFAASGSSSPGAHRDHWAAGVDDYGEPVTSVRCDARAKPFYTRVQNVKNAHEIQEIGESQEMDDDVVYILDALQAHNPTATRCLAALQLAAKCMTPSFRMHVRAHGTITEFFRALRDAPACSGSLALCTAAVMFVLNQDNLNMDLDRDSLGLMLALLECGAETTTTTTAAGIPADDSDGLSVEQRRRNADKVREICADIKALGKATHLSVGAGAAMTAGTLAMETLLSLTSKRAGEWFKEEMRTLGGLAKVMSTVCENCEWFERPDGVEWTATLVERLRRVERCLRVVENVSTQNEENQRFLLEWEGGKAVRQLLRFYAMCDAELTLYGSADGEADAVEDKEAPGVVMREALVPTLKVLINLTHPFGAEATGSGMIGAEVEVFETSLHLLLHVGRYVPERFVFELNIMVLLLLMNLNTHTIANRLYMMESEAPSADGSTTEGDAPLTIRALIEYFYRHEEMAQQVEQNTDAILDNPGKTKGAKGKSQEEVDETVTKLLQKAGNHMEHTLLASYVSLVIGYLIMDSAPNQRTVRRMLHAGHFTEMVLVLEKYYTFLNLTTTNESSAVAHIKQTKMIMEYFKRCDKLHSEGGDNNGDVAATIAAVDADSDDSDRERPLSVTRAANAPLQYRSSRRTAAAAAAASSSSASTMYKPYR